MTILLLFHFQQNDCNVNEHEKQRLHTEVKEKT